MQVKAYISGLLHNRRGRYWKSPARTLTGVSSTSAATTAAVASEIIALDVYHRRRSLHEVDSRVRLLRRSYVASDLGSGCHGSG